MKICYVDEAGCTGPLTGPKIQPVFVVLGVVLDARAVHAFTQGFIELKRRFFPGAKTELRLDAILQEAKGSKLRHYAVCRDTPRDRKRARWAVGLLDGAVRLLEQHDARIFGRVWVKPVNGRFNGRAVYDSSGRRRGGLTVSDPAGRSGAVLFAAP